MKNRKSTLFIIIFLFAGLINCRYCLAKPKLSVLTTLFPLQEFSSAVGGERVLVELLLPPGAEPHTWEPRPSDIIKMNSADVFLYLGSGLEPWVDDLLKGTQNNSLEIVEVSSELAYITNSKGSLDPHIWLDFYYDQLILEQIMTTFSKKDPDGIEYYKKNGNNYKQKLISLDQQYQKQLKNCQNRTIFLAGHSAFGYLVKRYQLKQVPLHGLSPDSKPTAQKLAITIQLAKEQHIKTIFCESLVSDRLAKVLAEEIGASILVLNPGPNLTKEQLKSGITFLSLMEENLKQLKKGLLCE